MGETDYNALLYDKMKAEQDKYRDWLLNQPPVPSRVMRKFVCRLRLNEVSRQ